MTVRPDDLRGKARDAYDMWRNTFGLSEQAAVRCLQEDGQLPTSDNDRVVNMFREAFDLSESAARLAAAGRDGRPVQSMSEDAGRSAARPEPSDAWKLVASIEESASDLCRRGVSETKALREAAFTVFRAMRACQIHCVRA